MYPRLCRRLVDCTVLLLGTLLLPVSVLAADAHQAVQAKPGEIVLLRNVATRPAYRPAPPGMALMVNPSPQHEIGRALGTEELSDADYASLNAASPHANNHGTTVERVVDSALGGTLSGNGGHLGVAGDGVSNVVSGPLGAIGNTTRGIGSQVLGAMAQLPTLTPAAPVGH
jgi:hypothetical protein